MSAEIIPFRKPPVAIIAYEASDLSAPPVDRPSRHLLHPLMSPDAYRVIINRALRVATGGSTNITEIRQAIDLLGEIALLAPWPQTKSLAAKYLRGIPPIYPDEAEGEV